MKCGWGGGFDTATLSGRFVGSLIPPPPPPPTTKFRTPVGVGVLMALFVVQVGSNRGAGGGGGGGEPVDLNWVVDDRSGECLGPAGGKSAALGCFRVLWGWDPAPLGRDRTVSSGMRPMSAPTAAPAPGQFLYASLLAYGPIPPPSAHLALLSSDRQGFPSPESVAHATGQSLVSGVLPGSGQRGPWRCSVARRGSW